MSKVETGWKFNEQFRDIFLDIWYEKSPLSYNRALDICDKLGNEMIIWLSEFEDPRLYKTIYKQALEENQEEIRTRRLG